MPTTSALPFVSEGRINSTLGASGFRSANRFERDCITKTAISNLGRFCWKERFRSTVRKTSNSFSARARRSPFLIVAHPICGTVLTKCPVSSLANRRSTHSSKRILTLCHHFDHLFLRRFQKRDDLFSAYGWKTFEEIINGFSAFDVIDEGLDRHSRPGKNRSPTHHIRRCGYNLFVHKPIVCKASSKDQEGCSEKDTKQGLG